MNFIFAIGISANFCPNYTTKRKLYTYRLEEILPQTFSDKISDNVI